MVQHGKNASFLADKLNDTGIRTIYPGREDHPDHELMKNIMNEGYGFGGMMAIDFETAEKAAAIMEKMQNNDIGYLAVSLGYFKTLFSNSGKSTSSEIPEDVQREMGLSEGLVRFSVGLDNNIERTYKRILEVLEI
jgi:methionine-gamma-lyase